MASEQYPKERLWKVAAFIMGQSPPGSTYNEAGQGLPFFQGVKDFGFRHPTRRVYCTAPTRFAESGDILFSVRAPIGEINRAAEPCSIGRGLAVIRGKTEHDTTFIEYILRHTQTEWEILESQGAVFGNARKSDLQNLSIPWPEEVERKAIAHILGSLDDKIELNCQMNQTLDATARAIFKSWFVDFDPVRARRGESGFALNLPSEILDLFPDSFEDSEIGEVPRGWDVKTIGDVAEFAYGKALKASDRKPGDVPVFGSNGQVGLHNEVLVKGPGIVVGRKGNPGIVTWSYEDFFPIDTTFYVKKTGVVSSLNYLFYALKFQDLPSLSADSAVPGLNRNLAYMSNFLVPSEKVLKVFDGQIDPLFQTIYANEKEIKTLASLRDTLLPKLISGELRVPDAEKFVEDAGL